VVNNGTNGSRMRPRANTISHIDGAARQAVQMIGETDAINARQGPGGPIHGHSRHGSLIGLPIHEYHYGGMSEALSQRGMTLGLPKLEPEMFNNVDFSGGMRTAPPMAGYATEFDFDSLLAGSGSTINPNALHYDDASQAMSLNQATTFPQYFSEMTTSHSIDENFDWVNGFDHHLNFTNENAVDESSPSALSTGSQSGISEVMLDGSNNPSSNPAVNWQQAMMAPPLLTPALMDFSTGGNFNDFFGNGPLSPHTLQTKHINDPYSSTPPPSMSSSSPSILNVVHNVPAPQLTNCHPDTPVSTHGGHSVLPLSTITESTRQVLVMSIAHFHSIGSRRVSSPLTSHLNGHNNRPGEGWTVPSTQDLQKYVGSYIRCFHPHLPFLHIPTLSFDLSQSSNAVSSGRGCLILSMAAIGALYESDAAVSRHVFELAKKMLQMYLEERRKADVRKVDSRRVSSHDSKRGTDSVHTPVWLVQAMLLNVIYGHNCGDKTAGDIASTHCAALVSLTRAAELLEGSNNISGQDATMYDEHGSPLHWDANQIAHGHAEWLTWSVREERKRTLYGVFILSSLLVSAYNHTPSLTNTEVVLDLPCDEEFWQAESVASFNELGGIAQANHNRVSFHSALAQLLSSREKEMSDSRMDRPFNTFPSAEGAEASSLRPSTFGCLILINALHNYIWETRQRHHSIIWTKEETEKMHAYIEPALRAWRAAWDANPRHSVERPNPFGLGPLSADCIPLLDLAYVRLFVNLSRSKEKFWKRDYEGMAAELSRDSEVLQHAEYNSESDSNLEMSIRMLDNNMADRAGIRTSSRHELHLRKAAFHAANSLAMSDKLGVSFADFATRELPLQSAMCAFDCAQVLAEWVATVQERVGRYVGILGRHDTSLESPAIILLEEDDLKLLMKCQEILRSADVKLGWSVESSMGSDVGHPFVQDMEGCGYGSKILRVTAYMLDKAAVWPGQLFPII
jgi:hypothetical protein